MKKKATWTPGPARSKTVSRAVVLSPVAGAFDEIVTLIRATLQRATRAVTTELIQLHWPKTVHCTPQC